MKRFSAFIVTCDYQRIILTTPNHHDFVCSSLTLSFSLLPIAEILIPYISGDITTLRAYNSFLCYAKMLLKEAKENAKNENINASKGGLEVMSMGK